MLNIKALCYFFPFNLFFVLVIDCTKGTIVNPGVMETKLHISHKCLWNCIELIGNIQLLIKYLDEEPKCHKLLNYLIRFFEVWEKFAQVYFTNYKLQSDIDRFTHNTKLELNKVCCCLLEIVKVRVHVLLCDNVKANDIIKVMCFKEITKFQAYLVDIDFFNKEMFWKSTLNLE